jgi:4-hydroxybenzoate polyprenyltransferase
MKPWIEVTRPENALAAAVTTILGGVIASGAWDAGDRWPWLVRTAFAAALGVGAANAFNDARDAGADAVHRSDRPIPRGDLTPVQAVALAGVLAIGALVMVLGRADLIVLVVVGAVGSWAYSRRLQYLAAAKNVAVALMSALTVVGGALATVDSVPFAASLAAGALLSYVAAYEVISDFDDEPSDRRKGARTWAMLSPRSARTFVVACLFAVPVLQLAAAVAAQDQGRPTGGAVLAFAVTATLCGLLVATVVRPGAPAAVDWHRTDHLGKIGWLLVIPGMVTLV